MSRTKVKGKCLTDRQIKKFIRFQCEGDSKDYSNRKETVGHLGLCWDCSERHKILLNQVHSWCCWRWRWRWSPHKKRSLR